MWLSEQTKAKAPAGDAEVGMTTITGNSVAVVTRGEQRDLAIYGPGGYVWLPAGGEQVVVLQGGPGGAERWIGGCQQGTVPAGMQPGEVYLHSGRASIHLKNNGTVAITGDLVVNGQAYRPCSCGEVG